MNILIIFGMVAFLSLPLLLTILRRRGTIIVTAKQVAFTLATLSSLFVGSAYLVAGHPKTLFSVTPTNWIVAIALSLLSWVYGYLLSLWIYKQLYQK